MSYDLIYSIGVNEHLGPLIFAHVVNITENGKYMLVNQKINLSNLRNFPEYNNEFHRSNIQKTELYSHTNLHRRYCKKNSLKPKDFIEKHLDKGLFDGYMRPYIEIQLNSILRNLMGQTIFLKFRDNPTHQKLQVAEIPADISFKFDNNEIGMQYSIDVQLDGNQLNLKNPTNLVLVNDNAWSIIDNHVVWFEESIDGKKLKPFFEKDLLNIPESSRKTYLQRFVEPLIVNRKVSGNAFVINELTSIPKVALVVVNDSPVKYIPRFQYGNKVVNIKTNDQAFVELLHIGRETTTFNKINRNAEFENHFLNTLKNSGFISGKNSNSLSHPSNSHPSAIINELISKNPGLELQLLYENFENEFVTGAPEIALTVKKRANDFHVQVKAFIGTTSIPIHLLAKQMRDKSNRIELDDNKVVIIPDEWLNLYRNFFSYAKRMGDEFILKSFHEEFLPKTNLMSKSTKQTDEVEFIPGKELFGKLRNYQKDGLKWLGECYWQHYGACLADDMGLGKTIQAIAALDAIYSNPEKIKKTESSDSLQLNLFNNPPEVLQTLIVAPTSLLDNWLIEINKYSTFLNAHIYSGLNRIQNLQTNGQHQILITSYGLLRNDIDFFKKQSFEVLILDESQMIKNPVSKVAKAAVEIKANFRITLTGTPIENSLKDLWSQMNFLNPGILGSYSFFKNEFVHPIEKLGDREKIAELKKIIGPYILRRKKEDVAKELPPLTEQVLYCEMEEEQEIIYCQVVDEFRKHILHNIENEGLAKSKFHLLKGLTALRLISNHPKLYDKLSNASSGKFDLITDKLLTLQKAGHKILVFSQFVKHLNLLSDFLTHKKLKYSLLTGQTQNRQAAIDEFNHDSSRSIFLISLKAGGTGLNLTKADYVFIIDPWWNPFSEKQAIDRAHRIGQAQHVFSYKFITSNSIEDKILQLQKRKKRLVNEFIPLESHWTRDLNEEDILSLLS